MQTVRVAVELSAELAADLSRVVGDSQEALEAFVESAIHRELLLDAGQTLAHDELSPEEAQILADQTVAEVRRERPLSHA